MKIGVLGKGAREHAIVWKLCQHHPVEDIFFLPGNAGSDRSYPLDIEDFNAVRQFTIDQRIELLIVGPEQPLAKGIVDALQDTGVFVFGPHKQASELESSKNFAKKFMKKHGVATASFHAFTDVVEAKKVIASLNGQVVIKYDGLAAGKGVFVCSSVEEAFKALDQLFITYGKGAPFLVEEKLEGEEVSLLAITNGKEIKFFLPSQDYKRSHDQDLGLNTGGMGAYCPVPFFDAALLEQVRQKIIDPTLKGIQNEGMHFCGFIYFGLMMTNKGPQLLEYNLRLGDPETEVILPALKTDLRALITASYQENLSDIEIEFHDQFFVDVVLASEGYPKQFEMGYEITGLDCLDPKTLLFHAGTSKLNDKLVTGGGRVLNVVCSGDTLEEAVAKVYVECEKIQFKNKYYRKDIGRKKILVND